MTGPLQGVRVLDLAGPEAELTGRTLAELGAAVLKVEPPGGSASRRRAPFAADGSSLYWATVGLGRSSLVLDLTTPSGLAQLHSLLPSADVLVETCTRVERGRYRLGPDGLGQAYPRLVHVSVTPYGISGPKADWAASELSLEAASGRMFSQGGRDRPPLPIGFPHAYFHAGVQAAADAVIALVDREGSGRGQHLDVSIQAVLVHTQFGYVSGALLDSGEWTRDHHGALQPPPLDAEADAAVRQAADRRAVRMELLPDIWACADGFVAAPLSAGALPLATFIMDELRREDGLDPRLESLDWSKVAADVLRGRSDDALVRLGLEAMATWTGRRTKSELYRLAHERDFRLGPLLTTRELLSDTQLEARGYWTSIGGRLHPGPAVRPILWSAPPSPAPALDDPGAIPGEWLAGTGGTPAHSSSGYGPDGAPLPAPTPSHSLSPENRTASTTTTSASTGARPERDSRLGEDASAGLRVSDRAEGAFVGLKVADLSWVAVGPTIGRALADHGATVLRIESSRRLDVARTLSPFRGPEKGRDDSHWYAHHNASKYGVTLNLRTPEGRAATRRMVLEWADVLLESFSPGTMAKLGLDYPSLSAERPDLIMLSASLLGQDGPMSGFAGFGQQGVGLAGISTVTGWPDRRPLPLGAYTDVVAPKYGLAALAAAVLDRRTSGRGVHLDLAQVEASIRFIEPLVLDESVNGRTADRRGLRSDDACPHGVYPVHGDRRYVALSVETDQQWRTLVDAIDVEELTERRECDLVTRLAHVAVIDGALTRWLSDRDGAEVEAHLAGLGVACSLVASPAEVARDAQLWGRGFFVEWEHKKMGPSPYEAPATVFSSGGARVRRPAPTLGQHTDWALRDLLGWSEDEVTVLRTSGALD